MNKNEDYARLAISSIFTFFYFCLVFLIKISSRSNMVIYGIGCVLFILIYLVQTILGTKATFCFGWINRMKRGGAIILLLLIVLFYISWNWDLGNFFDFQFLLYYLVAICFGFIFYRFIHLEKNVTFRVLWSVFLLLVYGFCLYEPNFLEDGAGGMHHLDAYTTSIINATGGMPYGAENASIYGHHGILFYLPVKILGALFSQWTAISITIACFGVLSLICFLFVLSKLIKSDLLFWISSTGVCYFSFFYTYGGNHFQFDPHRYLFQSITLLFCYFSLKYPEVKWVRLLFWLVESFAVVWNAETGLVCAVVCTVCNIYISSRDRWSVWKVIINVMSMFVCLALAYGEVAAFNLLMGGEVNSIGTFLYPLSSSVSSVSSSSGGSGFNVLSLSSSLSIPVSIWFFIVVILLGYLCSKLMPTCKHLLSFEEQVGFMSSLLGLGVFGYYMNMPDNIYKFICLPSLLIVMTIILDRYFCNDSPLANEGKNYVLKKCGIIAISLFLLVLFSQSLLTFTGKMNKLIYHTHEEENLDSFISAIDVNIPDDTVFIGSGAPQLCAALDREVKISYMDFPDITPFGIEYLNKMIKENGYQHILSSDDIEWMNENKEKYKEVKRFDYYDVDGLCLRTYCLYQLKE